MIYSNTVMTQMGEAYSAGSGYVTWVRYKWVGVMYQHIMHAHRRRTAGSHKHVMFSTSQQSMPAREPPKSSSSSCHKSLLSCWLTASPWSRRQPCLPLGTFCNCGFLKHMYDMCDISIHCPAACSNMHEVSPTASHAWT